MTQLDAYWKFTGLCPRCKKQMHATLTLVYTVAGPDRDDADLASIVYTCPGCGVDGVSAEEYLARMNDTRRP